MTQTPSQPSPKTWSVGTLTYTRGQLGTVFFWLLWGDFCLTLMDNGVASKVFNRQLENLGASRAAIGFLNGTVMALMSALLVSVISTTSDRTRTRLGRRMPYLLWATPPLATFLILIGFSKQIAAALQNHLPWVATKFAWCAGHLLPGTAGLPQQSLLILSMMTVFLVLYQLCDMFPQSIYYYLWADVVPAKLMGTFACLFRVVAALGMFVFNSFIVGHADDHPEMIYVGAGLLYLVSFVAMSLIVKEGKYPPPPVADQIAGDGIFTKTWRGVKTYLRECFSHSYYIKYYAMSACFIIAVKSLNQFHQFYATSGLGLSMQRYGELIRWKDLLVLIPFLLMGPLVDRFHPLRASFVAYGFVLVASLASFFLIQGETSFGVMVTFTYVSIAIYQAATGAIGPRLLPRAQYGQFASAGAVVFNVGWAISSVLCGWFLDLMIQQDAKTGVALHPENYKYLFIWVFGFAVAGFCLTISVYRHWKRLGGDENYQPPVIAMNGESSMSKPQ